MFGQSNFGELIFAQRPGADTTVLPSWSIQCPVQTEWIGLNKNEIGIAPCNDGSVRST